MKNPYVKKVKIEDHFISKIMQFCQQKKNHKLYGLNILDLQCKTIIK